MVSVVYVCYKQILLFLDLGGKKCLNYIMNIMCDFIFYLFLKFMKNDKVIIFQGIKRISILVRN